MSEKIVKKNPWCYYKQSVLEKCQECKLQAFSEEQKHCEIYQKKAAEKEKYQEYCKYCNNHVKLCQTCFFFNAVSFDYEDDSYYDEELGGFTLWVWSGYCMNESMPNNFPAMYHKTKSNKKCEWYITKKEYLQLSKDYAGKELSLEEYRQALHFIRENKKLDESEET